LPAHVASWLARPEIEFVPFAPGRLYQSAVSARLARIGRLDLATTDLVNARSLLEKKSKALKLIETRPEDSPLAVQLFGAVPEEMRDAAQCLESMGIAAVDINMGCPVRKVCRVGGGSAMMTEYAKTARLVRGMVEAVRVPVTAKMRLGWNEQDLTAPDLARALEDAAPPGFLSMAAPGSRGLAAWSIWRAFARWSRRCAISR